VAAPRDSAGNYIHVPGTAFGPAAAVDTFTTTGYYHTTTGSAQRLPNGNTLCVESDNGMIREWNPAGTVVWQYQAAGNTPSAFKYGPDHPGIIALLGKTPVANPLLHRGLRLDVRRVSGGLAFHRMTGARVEVYTTSGKRLYSGTLDSDLFTWSGASSHETYFVRIFRGTKLENLRVAPLF
jgi:hypothetical protein